MNGPTNVIFLGVQNKSFEIVFSIIAHCSLIGNEKYHVDVVKNELNDLGALSTKKSSFFISRRQCTKLRVLLAKNKLLNKVYI